MPVALLWHKRGSSKACGVVRTFLAVGCGDVEGKLVYWALIARRGIMVEALSKEGIHGVPLRQFHLRHHFHATKTSLYRVLVVLRGTGLQTLQALGSLLQPPVRI